MAGKVMTLKVKPKLIDALKRRFRQRLNAGTLTREAYLNAVRRARETLEQNQLIEPARIEHSFEQIQREAENSRLLRKWNLAIATDAAKAAWSA